ncbi:shikimate kinase [Tomitella biformata]|uniref:shikimate kinase n=1 Tax=Tomitella biformata TaxID=630403 RepID=UPI000465C1AA|nr:shikimate kinase [Tomitella biformata]
MAPRAVLIGAPGAGKSTIGRRLAAALDVDFCDTDAEIEVRAGKAIPEIFAADGEPAFRELEKAVVLEALSTQTGIVSLGGGAILSAETRKALAGHTVVYLDISVGEGLLRTGITARVSEGHAPHPKDGSRPLLEGPDPAGRYRTLFNTRRPLYREVSTIVVRSDRRSPSKVVRELTDLFADDGVQDRTGRGDLRG